MSGIPSSFQEDYARRKRPADRIKKPGTSLLQNEFQKEIIESKPSSSTTPSASGRQNRASPMRRPPCSPLLSNWATSKSRLAEARRPRISMAPTQLLSRRLNLGSAFRGSPRLGHYVFAFVVLIRLIALARLTSSPFLLPGGGDMHFYDDWARQILQGRFTDHSAFYGLPLYAYLLAFLYKVFGYSPFVPGFLQACLDAGTATLLYKIALRTFRADGESIRTHTKAIGILAAAGWAFFVPAQAYSVILMPTAWLAFVFWFLVWQIIKAEHPFNPLRCRDSDECSIG